MTQKRLFGISGAIATAALIGGLLAGCMEKDLYDPNYGKEPLPDPSEYFGFETRGDVKLSVNYDVPGLVALLEVYDEDPMEVVDNVPVKKEGVEALFKIFTDGNGKYEGKMNIPTSVETVYLYTSSWGVPRCVKLDIKDGMASFDMSKKDSFTANTKAVTRSYDFSKGSVPYLINSGANLYSLCKWGEGGNLTYIYNSQTGKPDPINNGYVTPQKQVGNELIGNLVERLNSFFKPSGGSVDNAYLYKGSEITNINVTQEGTTLDLVFLDRDASFNNSFGYYYYKTSDGVSNSNMRKYIVFPNVAFSVYNGALSILKCGDKVRLLFWGEDGKPSEKFPKGYTVGWFIYADGYHQNENEIDITKPLITSNGYSNGGFVSVKDEKSGKTIIGVEDGANRSFCDLLFYVDASPESSIDNPNRPNIPSDDKPIEKPDAQENLKGTLAFEDIWPDGGDYDMNDVVIVSRIDRMMSKDGGKVSALTINWELRAAGTTYDIAGAVQMDKVQTSDVAGVVSSHEGFGSGAFASRGLDADSPCAVIPFFNRTEELLSASNTWKGQPAAAIRKHTTTVTFSQPVDIASVLDSEMNFFIAPKQRTSEIHMPGYAPTASGIIGKGSFLPSDPYKFFVTEGDQTKNNSMMWALMIPGEFRYPAERNDIRGVYEYFMAWASSNGAEHAEWYLESADAGRIY